jgi:hypothetical protein
MHASRRYTLLVLVLLALASTLAAPTAYAFEEENQPDESWT